jgi:hypothetical protein
MSSKKWRPYRHFVGWLLITHDRHLRDKNKRRDNTCFRRPYETPRTDQPDLYSELDMPISLGGKNISRG